MIKTFDAVAMQRRIRRSLTRRYSKHPELEERERGKESTGAANSEESEERTTDDRCLRQERLEEPGNWGECRNIRLFSTHGSSGEASRVGQRRSKGRIAAQSVC